MKSNDFSIVNNKYQWFYCHPCRPRYLTTNHCQILGSLSTFTPLKPLLYIFEIGARAKSTTGRTINVGERVGTTGFASSKLVVNAWPPIYIASDERMTPEIRSYDQGWRLRNRWGQQWRSRRWWRQGYRRWWGGCHRALATRIILERKSCRHHH